MVHEFFALIIIYLAAVETSTAALSNVVSYLGVIVKTHLYYSLIRTNLAKINICEKYIKYRIKVP